MVIPDPCVAPKESEEIDSGATSSLPLPSGKQRAVIEDQQALTVVEISIALMKCLVAALFMVLMRN
jgi:hypothetical protein